MEPLGDQFAPPPPYPPENTRGFLTGEGFFSGREKYIRGSAKMPKFILPMLNPGKWLWNPQTPIEDKGGHKKPLRAVGRAFQGVDQGYRSVRDDQAHSED